MLNSRDISLLRPDVAANCRIWMERCKAQGLNVLVTQTVRDAEYQEYLYAQGRTRPGSIVTNGKRPTFHWDKAGLAFDFCKNVRGHEYDDTAFFRKAADIAKEMGFSWGGDWKSFVDLPHIQWDDHGKYTSSMILVGKLPPTMPLYEKEEDEEDMDIEKLTDEQLIRLVERIQAALAKRPISAALQADVDKAVTAGITDGQWPNKLCTRAQCAAMVARSIEK